MISNHIFNGSKRHDLIVIAISGSVANKLSFEPEIGFWREAGLLKPSIIKAAIATIEQSSVIRKLGELDAQDQMKLRTLLDRIIS